MKREQPNRRRGILAKHITLFGLRAAGRQVALLLAACSVRKLQLVDGGTVRHTHISQQGYLADDVGRHKAHATADICQQICPQLDVEEVPHDFRAGMSVGEVVFCCECDAGARSRIQSGTFEQCQFWGEIEVCGDVIRVVMDHGNGLRDPDQVNSQTACGNDKVTLPVAIIASSLLVQQFMRLCAGQQFDREIVLDLARAKYLRRRSGGAIPDC